MRGWRKYEGEARRDIYGLCNWRFVVGPDRLMLWHSGPTLEGVLAEIPENMMDDRLCIIRIHGWLVDSGDASNIVVDPDRVSTLFEIQKYDEDEEEEAA